LQENSADYLRVPNIFQRIGVEKYQIRELARLDGPERVLQAQELSCIQRGSP